MSKPENWETFQERLKVFSQQDQEDIEWAYRQAKGGHKGQMRDGGLKRYFEHPRETTLILFDECKIRNPRIIIASLLHDIPEDSPILGSALIRSYSDWVRIISYRLSRMFDWETAQMVVAVTKPKIDGVEITTKQQAEELYLENLSHASPEAIVVKMADRLHNLRTLATTTPEKQARKIKETIEEYFPIFEGVSNKYHQETDYLIGQMKLAISNIGYE